MPYELGVDLLEEIAKQIGRDAGAAFAAQMPWSDVGVLGYVLLHTPTLGAAITHLRRYLALQQTAGVFALEIDADRARLTYALRLPPHEPARQHTLAILGMATRLVRDGIGEPTWAPDEVTLPHPPVARDASEFFGVAITHGAPIASLVFPAELLRRAMVRADAGLLPILVQHADECLAKLATPLEDDLLARLRRAIAERLGDSPAIDDVASAVGSSARSIQRYLQAKNQSFKQIVDEVRLSMAKRHLADPALTLTDTAFLLGYSDLSAFSRAFRRWTGKSPQDYRREDP